MIFKDDIGIYDLGNYTTTFESKIKHSKCTKIKWNMKHSINTQCTLYFVCILICDQYFPIRIFFSQIYFPIANLLGNLLTPHISIISYTNASFLVDKPVIPWHGNKQVQVSGFFFPNERKRCVIT